MQDEKLLEDLEELVKKDNLELFKISAATNVGLEELFNKTAEMLKTIPKENIINEEEKVIYTLVDDEEEKIDIKVENGIYIVSGNPIERLLGRVNLEDNESLYYFQKSLKKLGVDERLRKMGIKEGDTVKFVDWEMEWYN